MRPVFIGNPLRTPSASGQKPFACFLPTIPLLEFDSTCLMSKRKDPENENNEGVFEKTPSLPNLHPPFF
jgi:hypothetical protein